MAFPPVYTLYRPVDLPMLGNGPDIYKGQPFSGAGDCVWAYGLHQITIWSSVAHAGNLVEFTCDQAIDAYSKYTGYNPSDPSTDNGTDPAQLFQVWKTDGLYGHKIEGEANLDISNPDALKWAIYTFGGIGLSIQVPAYLMDVPAGGSWSVRPGADKTIEGLHQIGLVGYGRGGFRGYCWGTTYTFNPDFLAEFATNSQAAVSSDWIKASGVSPTGVDLAGLLQDLTQV